ECGAVDAHRGGPGIGLPGFMPAWVVRPFVRGPAGHSLLAGAGLPPPDAGPRRPTLAGMSALPHWEYEYSLACDILPRCTSRGLIAVGEQLFWRRRQFAGHVGGFQSGDGRKLGCR